MVKFVVTSKTVLRVVLINMNIFAIIRTVLGDGVNLLEFVTGKTML